MIAGVPLIWLFFGIGAAMAASNCGHSAFAWFLLGLLLGPFGLLFALLSSDKKAALAPIRVSALAPAPIVDYTKTCPQCAETIKFAALKGRFCGHSFDPDQVKQDLATFAARRQDKSYCPRCGHFDVHQAFRQFSDGSGGNGP